MNGHGTDYLRLASVLETAKTPRFADSSFVGSNCGADHDLAPRQLAGRVAAAPFDQGQHRLP
jgi:hypothetical protein